MGRYLCEKCLQQYHDGTDCVHCEDEPLLDLEDEDTVLYLQSRDDADRSERNRKFTIVAMVLCVPLMGVGFLFGGGRRRGYGHTRGNGRLTISAGAYIGGVLGLSRLMMGLWPPRRRVPPGGF